MVTQRVLTYFKLLPTKLDDFVWDNHWDLWFSMAIITATFPVIKLCVVSETANDYANGDMVYIWSRGRDRNLYARVGRGY